MHLACLKVWSHGGSLKRKSVDEDATYRIFLNWYSVSHPQALPPRTEAEHCVFDSPHPVR